MRVVLIGCVEFSKSMLNILVKLDIELVGVVTKRDTNYNSDFGDLGPVSESLGIKTIYTKNINDPTIVEEIKSLNPDYLFCFGWNQLLSKDVMSIPTKDTIGYHPAKIPYNRGRHPIIWALALGLSSTASTFFSIEEEADSGDILSQIDIDITYEDDAQSLYNKLTEVAQVQISELVSQLEQGSENRKSQKGLPATHWRKRGRHDGKIDFRMSKRTIYNQVRALTRPYVGSHIDLEGNEIKVWKIKELDGNFPENIEPGKVLEVSQDLITVKVADGAIQILDHEFLKLPTVGDYINE